MGSSAESLEARVRRRLARDFPFYAGHCLQIRTKAGGLEPLALNNVQLAVHRAMEAQRAETGRVRVLVLKARQMGMSTLTEARFYWRTTHRQGSRAYILTHSDEATQNLFGMAKRFHEHCPADFRPMTTRSNANEMAFGLLDSSYRVATAQAGAVGRSDTIQLFHGSEVAFWARAEEHMTGAMQAVPRRDDTEVVLESTANGLGGMFYSLCKEAEAGHNDYRLIFMPWFAHSEYRDDGEPFLPPTADWREYAEAHGLDEGQLRWAYVKNQELAAPDGEPPDAPCWRFKQEYPATAQEAFQASGARTFIKSEWVAKARRAELRDPGSAPLILGVDVAASGSDDSGDETWIISRRGRVAGKDVNERMKTDDQMEIAGRLARIIDEKQPRAVFIDVGGGYGSGVVARLRELEYSDVVKPVQFGAKPYDQERYANKRAEMWGDLRDWLRSPEGVEIPDMDLLHTHLCAPTSKMNSNSQTLLESKRDIRKRLQLSPDGGDALALTFAEPVRTDDQRVRRRRLEYPQEHVSHGIV